MKDKEGIELVEGDLIMLTIDTPVEKPSQLVIFLNFIEEVTSIDSNGNETSNTGSTLHYYPISDLGLEVAKFDNGVTQTGFYRKEKYTATNINSINLLKMKSSNLKDYKKTLYDAIVALL